MSETPKYKHVREFWTQIMPVYLDRDLPERYRGEYETQADAEACATTSIDGTRLGRVAKMRVTIEEA